MIRRPPVPFNLGRAKSGAPPDLRQTAAFSRTVWRRRSEGAAAPVGTGRADPATPNALHTRLEETLGERGHTSSPDPLRDAQGRGGAPEVSFGPTRWVRTKADTGGPTGTRSARINRGDVFWVGPDPRGSVPGHPHPHVVAQDDVFNHSRVTTVIVCALTSNLHQAKEPGNVLLGAGEGDLPKLSVVVVSRISSVDETRLGERIGSLSDARVEEILAGLRFQQASFFRR